MEIIQAVVHIFVFILCTCGGGFAGAALVKTRKGFITGCLIGVLAGTATVWGSHQDRTAKCDRMDDGLIQSSVCVN